MHASESKTVTTYSGTHRTTGRQKLTVKYCASGGPGLDGGTDWNSIFRARAPKNSEFAAPGYFWPVKVVNLTLTTPNQ